MERTLRFYADVLGGAKAYQFPPEGEPVFITLAFGETELGICVLGDEPIHGRPLRPATGHRIELCLYVDDVDQRVTALSAIGAATVVAPVDQPWGERIAYMEDPDGNLVMLVTPLARP